jgi:predicted DCC family thiol-disulfide oxidoreductase YuxK
VTGAVRARPVLLYDGVCGFCARLVEVAVRLPADVDHQPYQTADLPALGVSRAEAEASLQWVDRTGRISSGAAAVGQLLVAAGPPWSLLGRLVLLPPLSWAAAVVYHLVARARGRLPGTTPALARPPEDRPRRD